MCVLVLSILFEQHLDNAEDRESKIFTIGNVHLTLLLFERGQLVANLRVAREEFLRADVVWQAAENLRERLVEDISALFAALLGDDREGAVLPLSVRAAPAVDENVER